MANPFKGEVSFDVGGTTYKLSFSANALAELEKALGRPIQSAQDEATQWSTMRTVFWAGLTDHWPEVQEKDVKLILSRLSPQECSRLIGEALALTFPPESANGQGGEIRPPNAAAGIGKPS